VKIRWDLAFKWAADPLPREENTEWTPEVVQNAAAALKRLREERDRLHDAASMWVKLGSCVQSPMRMVDADCDCDWHACSRAVRFVNEGKKAVK
jgi:hypothetical protein